MVQLHALGGGSMALAGLVNLAGRLLNQTTAQAQDTQTPQTPAQPAGNTASPAAPHDQFIPSTQTQPAQASAEAAGLFAVSQFTVFTPAADSLLAQAAAPQANQANAPARSANSTAPAPTQTAAATNAPAASPVSATATGTATVEDQLRALNNVLQSIGLSLADIRKIDRIASLINDFNPAAFTSLAYQFAALAHNSTPQTTATPVNAAANVPAVGGATAGPHANTANAEAEANGANANGGGLQLQGVNLQVQLTLTNNRGQTVHVQAPQEANANPPTGGDQAPALTKAATP
jgi:hypothetical protein